MTRRRSGGDDPVVVTCSQISDRVAHVAFTRGKERYLAHVAEVFLSTDENVDMEQWPRGWGAVVNDYSKKEQHADTFGTFDDAVAFVCDHLASLGLIQPGAGLPTARTPYTWEKS